MGTVWAARHAKLDTEVAVKFIAPDRQRADSAKRFAREARMAARVQSPHVVRVFDHGATEDGTMYIVMELLDGESLEARIEREGALAPAVVGKVVSQIAEALHAAHALGVVHRDIKPAQPVFAAIRLRHLRQGARLRRCPSTPPAMKRP